ncbi:MAG: divalent-cation tolerance protein CutA [Acidobacteriaceae bacterium]
MLAEASPVRIALTTVSSHEEGRRLARALVERRLAACVNLVPNLTSVYRWQGTVDEAAETLLLIKTTAEQLSALEAALGELHSYEVPEFLALTPESGSQAYLAWLLNSVNDSANL